MLCPSQERSRCYQGYCLPYPFLLSIHPFLSDRPCKIVDMSTSKTGKHGHAKVHLVGIDVRSLFSLSPNKNKKKPPFFISLRSSLEKNMSVHITSIVYMESIYQSSSSNRKISLLPLTTWMFPMSLVLNTNL